jgi:hypothetical protein
VVPWPLALPSSGLMRSDPPLLLTAACRHTAMMRHTQTVFCLNGLVAVAGCNGWYHHPEASCPGGSAKQRSGTG